MDRGAMLDNEKIIESLTNKELADHLLKEVWVKLGIDTFASTITEEAIERLRDNP